MLGRRRGEELAAVVDGVGDGEVAGQELVKAALRLLRERRQREPVLLGDLGHQGARPTGDAVQAQAVARARGQLGEQRRGLEELVEIADAHDTVLGEQPLHHRVRSGEVAGVGLGHAAAGTRAAHLDHHDRLALVVGSLERAPELAAVAEPLDVGGDDGRLVVVGEVLEEVGNLEIRFVAGRHPTREGDAEVGALHQGSSVVTALCE